jgi:hypothetical protein
MSGLHTRIARTIGCDSRYGTLEKYLHRNLLWHASDLKLQKIKYKSYVPSWSWMAYHGGIRFQDEEEIPFGTVQWVTDLRFDERCDYALIADVGVFQDCTMESEGSRYAVFDLSETNRGWIRYDVKDGKNLLEEHCVVVGKRGNSEYGNIWDSKNGNTGDSENGNIWDSEDGSTVNSANYYILLVRPTTVDGEYKRVGMGQVSKNCLVRTRANMRVV